MALASWGGFLGRERGPRPDDIQLFYLIEESSGRLVPFFIVEGDGECNRRGIPHG
uniref:Uncharacterized protein n=1 Tax=Candidatus Kentrum sp. SD TaxID=2126332 RepID=A0A450YD61_9GAMM|nr:MAG: hypothetical protein BECKSD772F_GA0070984_104019 [Candidatus Kentron sp. SD]VFK44593.1 MAG: hypothetical protein BECKSD772E_GA0070983_104019 [Candidatus Kentron sp. SD]